MGSKVKKMKDDLWFHDRGCECDVVDAYMCDFCEASSDWRNQTDLVEQVYSVCRELDELATALENLINNTPIGFKTGAYIMRANAVLKKYKGVK